MSVIEVHHYNAFTTETDKGNPAGVVFEGQMLTEAEMLQIAKQVGFNETVFILPSNSGDLRLRYFTPGHEVNLCGHATIASLYALRSRGLLSLEDIRVETNIGVLPMKVFGDSNDDLMVTMKQGRPEFVRFNGSLDALADAIGLTRDEIDEDLPVVYGSTGLWTLLVPIKKLESFASMKPRTADFHNVLEQMPRVSVHPFCLETEHKTSNMHARHFSSPFSGTTEDPVTGTASGVMGAYYYRYIQDSAEEMRLVVEQGAEIGREGFVEVTVGSDGQDIRISGTGAYVCTFMVTV